MDICVNKANSFINHFDNFKCALLSSKYLSKYHPSLHFNMVSNPIRPIMGILQKGKPQM